jgi:hypothetical protein
VCHSTGTISTSASPITFNDPSTLTLTSGGTITVGSVDGGGAPAVLSIAAPGAVAVTTGNFQNGATLAFTSGTVTWTQSVAFTSGLIVNTAVTFGAATSVSSLALDGGSLTSTNFALTAASVTVNGAHTISTGYGLPSVCFCCFLRLVLLVRTELPLSPSPARRVSLSVALSL